MKFKKLESDPEKTTFGSLPIGAEFIYQNNRSDWIFVKIRRGQYITEDGCPWNFNCFCLNTHQLDLTQDIEPIYIVESVLEFKVVR